MISRKLIEEVKTRLVETYKPLEIYLFGLYARERLTSIATSICLSSSDVLKKTRTGLRKVSVVIEGNLKAN